MLILSLRAASPACSPWLASCNNRRVAANPATGIGVPDNWRTHRPRAVFLCLQHGKSFCGRAVWRAFGLAGSNCRYANLHGSALPDWRQGWRKTIRTIGAIAMTQRHTLALNPSLPPERVRANWHRRMAMACLKANSSLAVRLARYHAHIEKARALEAIGGAA